jgi:hypothetical protein
VLVVLVVVVVVVVMVVVVVVVLVVAVVVMVVVVVVILVVVGEEGLWFCMKVKIYSMNRIIRHMEKEELQVMLEPVVM